MKRLGRIIFKSLAVLSLLLCLASAALWVRSYFRFHFVSQVSRIGMGHVGVSRGEFTVGILRFFRVSETERKWPSRWGLLSRDPDDLIAEYSRTRINLHGPVAGFLFSREVNDDWSDTVILIPMPLVVAFFALVPFMQLMLHFRQRGLTARKTPGYCEHCGYDLRASSDRCPECGTAVNKPTAAAPPQSTNPP